MIFLFLLWAESFHYVLATIAVTLTIGTALGYVLCRTFSQIGLLGKLNYTFPLLPMLIFFVALIVIALEYSALAIRYCEKRTLAYASFPVFYLSFGEKICTSG